jgi:flagellar basal-body rod protein FlgB
LDGISDLTMATTQFALDGLTQRAQATANNVANVNTPGYQATSVSFESALASALTRGTVPGAAQITTTVEPGTPNSQGNTVSLETEMVGGIKDSLTYQTMVSAFNYKVDILKTAIGSQS